jgi:hypothetical protein
MVSLFTNGLISKVTIQGYMAMAMAIARNITKHASLKSYHRSSDAGFFGARGIAFELPIGSVRCSRPPPEIKLDPV